MLVLGLNLLVLSIWVPLVASIGLSIGLHNELAAALFKGILIPLKSPAKDNVFPFALDPHLSLITASFQMVEFQCVVELIGIMN